MGFRFLFYWTLQAPAKHSQKNTKTRTNLRPRAKTENRKIFDKLGTEKEMKHESKNQNKNENKNR